MPKRRKRSTKTKQTAKDFIGDKLLAIYHAFSCSCCIGMLGFLSMLGFGVASYESFATPMKRQVKGDSELVQLIEKVLKMTETKAAGIALAAISAILMIFAIWFIIATWRSRKWALWLTVIIQTPGAILSLWSIRENPFVAVFSLVLSIYAILRVTGNLGPKLS